METQSQESVMKIRVPYANSYLGRKVQGLLMRTFGGSATLRITMTEKGMQRFEVLRANVAQVRGGKPTSYNDVVEGAITAYYKLVKAHEAGVPLYIADAEGKKVPIKIFK